MARWGVAALRFLRPRPPIIHVSGTSRGFKRWFAPTLKKLKDRQKYLEREKKVPVLPRSALSDWNRNAELFAFGKRLNEEFHIEVLNQAFIHRSYIIQEEIRQQNLGLENPQIGLEDNRELIKIGENQISKNVMIYLEYSLPKFPREGIKAIHDYLTSNEVCTHISKNLGTKDIIMSGSYPPDDRTYADTFLAIVGALSKSTTEEKVFLFVRDFVMTQLAGKDVNDFYPVEDAKQTVCEILKRDGRPEPEPRIIGESAIDTVLASYVVGIYCDKQLIGQSGGESVDIAVDMAYRDVLRRLFNTTESAQPIRYDINWIEQTTKNLSLNEWSNKNLSANWN